MTNTLLPTTLVGSYAMPDWLIDREKLASRFPPRTRALELWRVDPEFLEEAQDDATLLAIRDQERAGLDIVTDGEMRRESYSNRFATALGPAASGVTKPTTVTSFARRWISKLRYWRIAKSGEASAGELVKPKVPAGSCSAANPS